MRKRILLVTLAASVALIGAGAVVVARAVNTSTEAGYTWGGDNGTF